MSSSQFLQEVAEDQSNNLDQQIDQHNDLNSSDQQSQQSSQNDATPAHRESILKADQLTSYSRKKSFDIKDHSNHSQQMMDGDNDGEDVEFLLLENQISQPIPGSAREQSRDPLAMEETKSRKSETQSMRGVSFATSDTEDNRDKESANDNNQVQDPQKRRRKRKLSKVDEELKATTLEQRNSDRQHLSIQKSMEHNRSVAQSQKSHQSQKDRSKRHEKHDKERKRKKRDSESYNIKEQKSHEHRKNKNDESMTSHQANQNMQQKQLEMMTAAMQQNPWMQMMMLMGGGMPPNPYGMPPMMMQQPGMMPQQQILNPMSGIISPNPYAPPNMMGVPNPYMGMNQMNHYQQQQMQSPQDLAAQKEAQIKAYLKQLKDQGQLHPQLLELMTLQETLKSEIDLIQQENSNLQTQLEIQTKQREEEALLKAEQQKLAEMQRQQEEIQRKEKQVSAKHSISEQQQESSHNLQEDNNGLSKEQNEENEENKNEEVDHQQNNEDNEEALQTPQTIQEEPLKIEEFNEQDEALNEIAMMAARGHDPTADLERENEQLQQTFDELQKREKEYLQKVTFLDYENEILFGKSNSMDNSIQNYGKRLEELSKQIDELNAILRIKDHEMIEMTNDIHKFRMMKEGMRKEILFRKQRQEQMEGNLRKIQGELDKALYSQDELNKGVDMDLNEVQQIREENKRLKQAIEKYRSENMESQEEYDNLKTQMNTLTTKLNELENKMFSSKSSIDRIRNENEQVKVDLSYTKASSENQRDAYEKLSVHYSKQLQYNNQLDSERTNLLNNQFSSQEHKFSELQKPINTGINELDFQSLANPVSRRGDFMDYNNGDHETKKRSSSQDVGKTMVQSRNFNSNLNETANQQKTVVESKVKKGYIDLSSAGNPDQSITGHKRRGAGVSQTRDFNNRNFVSQMPGILTWQNQANGAAGNDNLNISRSRATVKGDNKLSYTQQDSFKYKSQSMNTSQLLNHNQPLSTQQQNLNESIALPQKHTDHDMAKIQHLQDELTKETIKREQVKGQLSRVSDKFKDAERRDILEQEMTQVNKRIGDIKKDLRKLDALRVNQL